METSNTTKKILYTILLFLFAVGAIVAIFYGTIQGEINRRERWDEEVRADAVEQNLGISASQLVSQIPKKERFYFERFREDEEGGNLLRCNVIKCIRTGNVLALTMASNSLEDVTPPPNFAVYPDDGSNVSFQPDVVHESETGTVSPFIARLCYWSLVQVQAGRYCLAHGAFSQVRLNANDPSSVEFDTWLNYTGEIITNHTFEFVQEEHGSPAHILYSKAKNSKIS